MKVLEATKLIDDQGQIGENLSVTNNVVIMKDLLQESLHKRGIYGSRFDK